MQAEFAAASLCFLARSFTAVVSRPCARSYAEKPAETVTFLRIHFTEAYSCPQLVDSESDHSIGSKFEYQYILVAPQPPRSLVRSRSRAEVKTCPQMEALGKMASSPCHHARYDFPDDVLMESQAHDTGPMISLTAFKHKLHCKTSSWASYTVYRGTEGLLGLLAL